MGGKVGATKSNSHRKMDVVVTDVEWGKLWVKVTLKNSKTFIPSFEDIFRIIQAICYCEDRKFPNGKGREMVAEFLKDCVHETNFADLAERYDIPIREWDEEYR